ncbi:hypothetical protein ANN_21301 [Periplaneta americana]|uniref:Uncharacterized protein n=1 Tax=Periplaneta americana TaxID=6978 RepID=A0ABQ8SFA8_PERAM|nr:hypothetical protein ANN_21301 [Periplaneta americana]
MPNERIPKKVLYSKIGGNRRVCKPRSRCIDVIEEDTQKILAIRIEKEWHKIEKKGDLMKEARSDIGLSCHKRRR